MCSREVLPAFKTRKELMQFWVRYGGANKEPKAVWLCPSCHQYHAREESGLARYPKNFRPFLRRPAVDPAEPAAKEPELPRREVPKASPKKLAAKLPRREPKVKKAGQPDLF